MSEGTDTERSELETALAFAMRWHDEPSTSSAPERLFGILSRALLASRTRIVELEAAGQRASSATPLVKPQASYTPLTEEQIERVRTVYKRHFSDGERLDTVCDMAIVSLALRRRDPAPPRWNSAILPDGDKAMRVHELKTWTQQFDALRLGDKTHEVRVNDRDYQEGDVLHLRAWNPRTQRYTGDELLARVTFITHGGNFGLPESLCCMSVKVLELQIDPEPRRATSPSGTTK